MCVKNSSAKRSPLRKKPTEPKEHSRGCGHAARSLFKRNSYFNFIFTLARRRVRVTRRGMRCKTKHPLAPVHAAAPRDIYEPTLCVPASHLPAVVSKHTHTPCFTCALHHQSPLSRKREFVCASFVHAEGKRKSYPQTKSIATSSISHQTHTH